MASTSREKDIDMPDLGMGHFGIIEPKTMLNKKVNDSLELFNEDGIEDETFGERLIGLTEMFPESIRDVVGFTAFNLTRATKNFITFGKKSLWIIFSSATILIVPLTIETTRLQMASMMLNDKKNILLGPNAHIKY